MAVVVVVEIGTVEDVVEIGTVAVEAVVAAGETTEVAVAEEMETVAGEEVSPQWKLLNQNFVFQITEEETGEEMAAEMMVEGEEIMEEAVEDEEVADVDHQEEMEVEIGEAVSESTLQCSFSKFKIFRQRRRWTWWRWSRRRRWWRT